MIYKYRKYKDIDSFVNNIAKTRIDEDYTILFKCNGYDYSKSEFTDRCFGCMFCIFSDPAIKTKFESVWGADFYKKYSVAQRRRMAKSAIAKKDAANILVNLRKPEHYLAHAYLVLCVKDEFVGSNDIVPGMKLGYLRTTPKTIEEHKFIALSYINDYINGNIVYDEIKKEIGRTK